MAYINLATVSTNWELETFGKDNFNLNTALLFMISLFLMNIFVTSTFLFYLPVPRGKVIVGAL